ncbi:hypothetical protein [Rhodococcus ruber]|uniref:hypothetical protein n=1 Tax=Rhodococcus ruber TaxID=1830 RepID=UPI000C7E0E06|nr:hypothetical protein [Rhodococcus ruber]AUM20277.1 hypothetical protein CSW53_27315 [Rhodococcus ruber]
MNRRTVTLAGVAIAAAATTIGVTTRFAPPEITDNTPATVHSVENLTEDLSDSQERAQNRMRDAGIDQGHAENAERRKVVLPHPPRFPR